MPSSRRSRPKAIAAWAPIPHANGGLLKKELKLPDFRSFAVDVRAPGGVMGEATRELGKFLRDVIRLNAQERNFRIMGPDETASNRLDAVFEATERVWMEPIESYDVHLAQDGRVMEVLSEHLCQGWLEGYLLTGRHGLFSCYEAFIHIVDSMFNQHAKWLKVTRHLAWRRPIASLNYLLTSHVWRARTTTASAIRIPASSISSPTRRPTSSASTSRLMPTRCCGSRTIACAPMIAST
ncbi:phosphoketolase [Bradyrhizobium sp. LM6.11]